MELLNLLKRCSMNFKNLWAGVHSLFPLTFYYKRLKYYTRLTMSYLLIHSQKITIDISLLPILAKILLAFSMWNL